MLSRDLSQCCHMTCHDVVTGLSWCCHKIQDTRNRYKIALLTTYWWIQFLSAPVQYIYDQNNNMPVIMLSLACHNFVTWSVMMLSHDLSWHCLLACHNVATWTVMMLSHDLLQCCHMACHDIIHSPTSWCHDVVTWFVMMSHDLPVTWLTSVLYFWHVMYLSNMVCEGPYS